MRRIGEHPWGLVLACVAGFSGRIGRDEGLEIGMERERVVCQKVSANTSDAPLKGESTAGKRT